MYKTIELKEHISVIHILLKLNEEKENNRIIKNQFTVLNLEERYKEQLNDQLSTIIEEFGEYYRQGKDIQDIIDMLKIRMRAYRKNNGTNYWVACLYDCLAGNPYALEIMLKIA